MKQRRFLSILIMGVVLLLAQGCVGKTGSTVAEGSSPTALPKQSQIPSSGGMPWRFRLEADEELWRDMNQEWHQMLGDLQQRLDGLEQSNARLVKEVATLQHAKSHPVTAASKKSTARAKPVPLQKAKNERMRDIGKQKDLYTHAYLALKKGKYEHAVKEFTKYLVEFQHGKYANLAHFWLGEAYYALGSLSEAEEEFSRVRNETANSDKHARALWRKVQIARQKGDQEGVLRNAQLLISAHPGSPEASRVKKLLQGGG